MFDHGCDMVNTFLATSTILKFFVVGNNWYLVITIFAVVGQFYYATLEEYFIDGLYLPIMNGPNEGLWTVICFCVFTFLVGPEFWPKDSLISGLPNNRIAFGLLVISSLVPILMK